MQVALSLFILQLLASPATVPDLPTSTWNQASFGLLVTPIEGRLIPAATHGTAGTAAHTAESTEAGKALFYGDLAGIAALQASQGASGLPFTVGASFPGGPNAPLHYHSHRGAFDLSSQAPPRLGADQFRAARETTKVVSVSGDSEYTVPTNAIETSYASSALTSGAGVLESVFTFDRLSVGLGTELARTLGSGMDAGEWFAANSTTRERFYRVGSMEGEEAPEVSAGLERIESRRSPHFDTRLFLGLPLTLKGSSACHRVSVGFGVDARERSSRSVVAFNDADRVSEASVITSTDVAAVNLRREVQGLLGYRLTGAGGASVGASVGVIHTPARVATTSRSVQDYAVAPGAEAAAGSRTETLVKEEFPGATSWAAGLELAYRGRVAFPPAAGISITLTTEPLARAGIAMVNTGGERAAREQEVTRSDNNADADFDDQVDRIETTTDDRTVQGAPKGVEIAGRIQQPVAVELTWDRLPVGVLMAGRLIFDVTYHRYPAYNVVTTRTTTVTNGRGEEISVVETEPGNLDGGYERVEAATDRHTELTPEFSLGFFTALPGAGRLTLIWTGGDVTALGRFEISVEYLIGSERDRSSE